MNQENMLKKATELHRDITTENDAANRRSRIWTFTQVILLVFIVAYMTWLHAAVSRLDANTVTGIASAKLESMLPGMREDLRKYAIQMAPQLTDRARDVFLELPLLLREKMEKRLKDKLDVMIGTFDEKLNAVAGQKLEEHIRRIKTLYPNGVKDRNLEPIIVDICKSVRAQLKEAVDLMYADFSREIKKMETRLARLKKGENLTEEEKIEKEMIEAWSVLVQKHKILKPAE